MDLQRRRTPKEKGILKRGVLRMMNELARKNARFSDKEIDRDIEYARKHAPR